MAQFLEGDCQLDQVALVQATASPRILHVGQETQHHRIVALGPGSSVESQRLDGFFSQSHVFVETVGAAIEKRAFGIAEVESFAETGQVTPSDLVLETLDRFVQNVLVGVDEAEPDEHVHRKFDREEVAEQHVWSQSSTFRVV